MAFYAELRRRRWYCINGQNQTRLYKKLLYYEWYNTLTDEQKEKLEKEKERKAEKAEYDLRTTMAVLETMINVLIKKMPDNYYITDCFNDKK